MRDPVVVHVREHMREKNCVLCAKPFETTDSWYLPAEAHNLWRLNNNGYRYVWCVPDHPTLAVAEVMST